MKHYSFFTAIIALMVMVLFSPQASAADAIAKILDQTPEPEVSITNWGGFYVAGVAGYGWGKGNLEHQNVNNFGGPGGTYSHDGNDFIYGADAGYRYQFGNNVVVGAELGIRNGFNIDDGGEWAIYNNYTSSKIGTQFLATGQVGYAFGDFLPYVMAGWAGSKISTSQVYSPVGLPQTTWSDSQFRNGYVVGAGVDMKVTERIFAGVRYTFTDYGKANFSGLDSSGRETDINGKYKVQTVSFRVGFKF